MATPPKWSDGPFVSAPITQSLRLRFGQGKQARFTIRCSDPADLERRCTVLRELAASLVASSRRPEESEVILRTLAGMSETAVFAAKYPDQVRLKKSAPEDIRRLRVINKVLGPIPVHLITLADVERAMAQLPKTTRVRGPDDTTLSPSSGS